MFLIMRTQLMNKTFILRIEESNFFSIKVSAKTLVEAEEMANKDINKFKPFDESGDFKIIDSEECF